MTSANLTEAALARNIEIGLVVRDRALAASVSGHFQGLIDRGVLRLAAAELLYAPDVPPKVAIQEGIRLAEQYGGPESPRFVNGVLDALYKRVHPAR